jgi:hypothetical protein
MTGFGLSENNHWLIAKLIPIPSSSQAATWRREGQRTLDIDIFTRSGVASAHASPYIACVRKHDAICARTALSCNARVVVFMAVSLRRACRIHLGATQVHPGAALSAF